MLSCGAIQLYVGLFDSSYSTAIDPFPLVTAHLHPASSYTGGGGSVALGIHGGSVTTRDIGGAMAPVQYAAALLVDGGLIRSISTSTNAVQKDPITGLWNAQRVTLMSNIRRALRRGLLKGHVLAIPMAEVSEGVGDTIVIDGTTYTCFLVPNPGLYTTGHIDSIWVSQAA